MNPPDLAPSAAPMSRRSFGLPPPSAASLAIVGYVTVMAALMLTGRRPFIYKTPLVPVLLLVALVGNRFRTFVQDWIVFLGGIVLFDAVRCFSYATLVALNRPYYERYPIAWDRALLGAPAVAVPLQAWIESIGASSWVDNICIGLHASHFAFFLLFGLALWAFSRRDFGLWVAAMIGTMAGGLIGYAAVPTVPPWLASMRGLVPPVVHITEHAYNMAVPTLRAVFDTNPVAAMPSIHIAFPTCCALAARRAWGTKGLLVWLYVAAMGFALAYLGEHYVVDEIAGLLLGLIAWTLVTRWTRLAQWIGDLGWCRWPTMRHVTIALAIVLAAMILSGWSATLVPTVGL